MVRNRKKQGGVNLAVGSWLLFMVVGSFFALMTPLGEGFDEPLHFGYIQHVAQLGTPPLGASRQISSELEFFLKTHPVSWSFHTLFPSLLSYEEYWSDAARSERDRSISTLKFSGRYAPANGEVALQYESHQPPLYYLVVAPVFSLASRYSFVDTFMMTRLFSVLLASLMVPGAFLLAQEVLKDKAAAGSAVSLVVLFPGLYPGVARVSNDSLAAVFTCWALYFACRFLEKRRRADLYSLTALLAAGLWTKAFFIPIFAGVVVVLLFIDRSARVLKALLVGLVLGSGWYLYTFVQTGSLTGLPETVLSRTSLGSSIDALRMMDWTNILHVATSSHIWIGNGSLIGVRSWMYSVIFWSFCLGVAGALRSPRRSVAMMAPIAIPYLVFIAALIYYATQVFQHTGTSVAQGWYLTSFIPVEAILFIVGVRNWLPRHWKWPAATLQLFFLVLLIYGALFVAMPYYAGITAHNTEGHLATYHATASDVQLMPARLLRFHPWIPQLTPWVLLAMTVCFGFWSIGQTVRSTPPAQAH